MFPVFFPGVCERQLERLGNGTGPASSDSVAYRCSRCRDKMAAYFAISVANGADHDHGCSSQHAVFVAPRGRVGGEYCKEAGDE